jgi:hypothetical protein
MIEIFFSLLITALACIAIIAYVQKYGDKGMKEWYK